MSRKWTRGITGAAIAALAMIAGATSSSFAQEDRLLGMVEPVKAAKPYRIGYASADMNSDFFLGLAYGAVDEAKRAGAQITRIVSAGGYGKVRRASLAARAVRRAETRWRDHRRRCLQRF